MNGGAPRTILAKITAAPLDVKAWYRAAEDQLTRAQTARPSMSGPDKATYDALVIRFRNVPTFEWPKQTATEYANIAQAAADLFTRASQPQAQPQPTETRGADSQGTLRVGPSQISIFPSFRRWTLRRCCRSFWSRLSSCLP